MPSCRRWKSGREKWTPNRSPPNPPPTWCPGNPLVLLAPPTPSGHDRPCGVRHRRPPPLRGVRWPQRTPSLCPPPRRLGARRAAVAWQVLAPWAAWKGSAAMIRLIVADVDGVFSLGEAAPFDYAVLQRLA